MAENTDNIAENVDRKHNIAEHVDGNHNIDGYVDRMQFFHLETENELRVRVGKNSDVKIKLLSGQAEVYGTEMELNKEYVLKPYSSLGIFTWSGCDIKLSGTTKAAYFMNETSMMLNVILHASLEERRLQAEAENKKGPVVLVVGQNDVSKSTLCRLLLNYAVCLGRHPLFVDIDVGQNSISLPDTIGVRTVKKTADIVNGFDDQPIEIYHYGYRSAWQSIVPYTLLLQRLSLTLRSDLMQTNQNVKTSGVIINGCDWSKSEIRKHGYSTVSLAAKIFEIDILCVLHEKRLYLDLKRNLPESVEIIFIPRIDKAGRRYGEDKSVCRLACINEYFYGPTNQLRQPFTFEVKFSDIQVFKVCAKAVHSYTQFLGEVKQSNAKLKRVEISRKLIDLILALSSADNVQIDIMYMPVTGFICVTDVDVERDVITVISPQPGPLSKKILLMGDTRIRKCQSGKKKVMKSENGDDKVTKSENCENKVTKSENSEDKVTKSEKGNKTLGERSS